MPKKNPAPADIVQDLLGDIAPPARRNMIGDMPELASAIEYFLDLKAKGEDQVAGISLSWFYREKLQGRFNGPTWFGTVRKYVREILKRDHRTGKAL